MTKKISLGSAILGALLVLPAPVAGKSVELNPKTFEEAVHTKNAFVKFYAPWCGHCKALAPDWDSLADSYSSSSSVVIGSFDCTDPNNGDICHDYGVQGYPTLKYFKDGNVEGEDYQGGRGLDVLKDFVSDVLDKKCFVGTEEEMTKDPNCSDRETAYATKMRGKTAEERKKQLNRLDGMKGDSMKPELKTWIMQRLNVLNGLEHTIPDEDEF